MRSFVLLVLFVLVAMVAGGCGPSPECLAYVACQNAYDDDVDTTPWEDGGVCWNNLQTAQLCTEQCAAALQALSQVPAPPANCAVAEAG